MGRKGRDESVEFLCVYVLGYRPLSSKGDFTSMLSEGQIWDFATADGCNGLHYCLAMLAAYFFLFLA